MHKLTVFLVVTLFFAAARPAFAYLDPGTGSFLLQMILAGLLGLGMTIKVWWRKIKDIVSRRKSDSAGKPNDL